MTTRHYPSFVNDKTDEDKLANIIVSTSLLDEVLSLWLTNHFLKIDGTKKNENDRDVLEKLILSKLGFRQKSEVVCKLLNSNSSPVKLKSNLFRVGEIRNQVAHNTGWLGIPNNIKEVYREFDGLMIELESFIELTYSEFQHDMDHAYNPQ
jgi:hypothetical protein